jgi:hypothetical protein
LQASESPHRPAGLLVVRASVTPEREAEFNDWYDGEHLPFALGKLPGALSARRFQLVAADETSRDEHKYLIVYEFDSDVNVIRTFEDGVLTEGIQEYDRRFGDVSQRVRAGYRQIYPAS